MPTRSCHSRRTRPLRLKRRSSTRLLLSSQPSPAGVVQTRTERLAGAVSFTETGLGIGEKSVPWDQASIVIPGNLPTIGESSVVHLATGELSAVDVLKMIGKKFHVQSSLLGERDLDLAALRAIDFLSGMSLSDKSDPATLYRDSGEPLPGTVLWIDPSRLAIDSPLRHPHALARRHPPLRLRSQPRSPAPPPQPYLTKSASPTAASSKAPPPPPKIRSTSTTRSLARSPSPPRPLAQHAPSRRRYLHHVIPLRLPQVNAPIPRLFPPAASNLPTINSQPRPSPSNPTPPSTTNSPPTPAPFHSIVA